MSLHDSLSGLVPDHLVAPEELVEAAVLKLRSGDALHIKAGLADIGDGHGPWIPTPVERDGIRKAFEAIVPEGVKVVVTNFAVNERKAMTDKWNRRFLQMAELVASWSKDPSTKCGAVIVRPDKTVASVGFNGFPKGCHDDADIYANRELKYARVVHAEVNAILHAQEPLKGYTLYSWPPANGPSCDRCTAQIIQAGIKTVVHVMNKDSDITSRWQESIDRGLQMYYEAGVQVLHVERTYVPA